MEYKITPGNQVGLFHLDIILDPVIIRKATQTHIKSSTMIKNLIFYFCALFIVIAVDALFGFGFGFIKHFRVNLCNELFSPHG